MSTRIINGVLILMLSTALIGCADDSLYNNLNVTNGSGSGEYVLGQTVEITADAPLKEMAFTVWNGDTAFLDDPGSPVTHCVMPLQDVQLIAIYDSLPTYNLTVLNGEGSGRYRAGVSLTIKAVPPADTLAFKVWEGDISVLDEEDEAVTKLTMPARDVTLKAVFQPVKPVSFNAQVYPIIILNCYACHGRNSNTPLTDYYDISQGAAAVVQSIQNDYMPPDKPLTAAQKEIIYKWIAQGKKNN